MTMQTPSKAPVPRLPRQTPIKVLVPTFTRRERRALQELKDRYRQDRDLFTACERARLSFLRWLCVTGRLLP